MNTAGEPADRGATAGVDLADRGLGRCPLPSETSASDGSRRLVAS